MKIYQKVLFFLLAMLAAVLAAICTFYLVLILAMIISQASFISQGSVQKQLSKNEELFNSVATYMLQCYDEDSALIYEDSYLDDGYPKELNDLLGKLFDEVKVGAIRMDDEIIYFQLDANLDNSWGCAYNPKNKVSTSVDNVEWEKLETEGWYYFHDDWNAYKNSDAYERDYLESEQEVE